MAHARKQLTALNAAFTIDIPQGRSAEVSLQYPNGGTGTLVLETKLRDVPDVAANWIAVQMRTPAGLDITTLAAAGIGSADCEAYGHVRCRMSVAGDCTPTLAIATLA